MLFTFDNTRAKKSAYINWCYDDQALEYVKDVNEIIIKVELYDGIKLVLETNILLKDFNQDEIVNLFNISRIK